MGFKLQDKIQKMRGIPGKYKRVLTAIANRARNDGTNFFEAKETIGAKSGVDRSTAFRNMDDLTEMGILPKAESHECGIDYCPRGTKHFSKPGNHWTQAYYIDLVALQKYDESRCKMLREKKKSGVAKRTRVALQNATEVALHFEMQTGDTREARFTGSVEPSVLTDGSKKASEPVSLATTSLASPAACPASQESQTLSGCDLISEELNQKQNQPQPFLPQTREEMYSDGLGSEFEPAIDLLHRISPNITDAMVREQLPLCARILSFFADTGEYNVQAAELVLKFNRAHRSGKYANKDDKKLYIRTAAQYLKALESENAFLLNDYDSHDFKNCETCRGAGVFDFKEWIRNIRQDELRQAEQEEKERLAAAQAAARRAEQERLAAPGNGVIMTMGKGGVGKTTIASQIAVSLASMGHTVHLTTTDPAAHVRMAVRDSIPNLRISRIDPVAETAAYTAEVMADAGRDLDEKGRAVLEEDLRSPCTEEIAVFRAFARCVDEGNHGFVVIDTAPTGHTLLLLDAAEAYHRDVVRNLSYIPDSVRRLLPQLRNPNFTRILIVTLPEATPVHEAARLQDDLRRAGITPYAWVINQSLAATETSDPVLAERAALEHRYIAEVQDKLAQRVALIPWLAESTTQENRLPVEVAVEE